MILIGSKALEFHINLERETGDTDIVGTYDEIMEYVKVTKPVVFYPFKSGRKIYMRYKDGSIVEADIAWPDSVEECLMKFLMTDGGTMYNKHSNMYVPSLDVLYMLKLSHRYLKDSPYFNKTRQDILLMRKHGAKTQPQHKAFYAQRKRDTYVYGLPKLNVTKDAFFDEVATGVVYTWDHDSIHEAVKHLDKPAYQYYSGGEVWSDMGMFKTLPESIKLFGVLEEALTLAAERSQLAFPDRDIDPKWSFDKALEKVCTSITSGEFRRYAWEAYDKVQALYGEVGYDYMERVRKGIESGTVKRSHQ